MHGALLLSTAQKEGLYANLHLTGPAGGSSFMPPPPSALQTLTDRVRTT